MAILKDFSGGLNNALDPDKISPSQATQLLNAENFGKGLRSKKKCTYTVFNEDTGPDYIDEGTDPYNSAHSRYFYEFTDKDGTDRLVRFRYNPYIVREDNGSNLDRIYGCDGINPPQEIKFYGNTLAVPITQADTVKRRLGIVRPTFEGNTISQGSQQLTITENLSSPPLSSFSFYTDKNSNDTVSKSISNENDIPEFYKNIGFNEVSEIYIGSGKISPTPPREQQSYPINNVDSILINFNNKSTNLSDVIPRQSTYNIHLVQYYLNSDGNKVYLNKTSRTVTNVPTTNKLNIYVWFQIVTNILYDVYIEANDTNNTTKYFLISEGLRKDSDLNVITYQYTYDKNDFRITHEVQYQYDSIQTLVTTKLSATQWDDISPGAIASNSITRKKYQFFVSYYNNKDNVESRQSNLSRVFNLYPNINYTVNNLPVSPDPQVTHKRVYIIDYATGITKLFGTTSNTTKTVSSYLAFPIDHVFNAQDNEPPPQNVRYFTQFGGRLFGAVGSELRWSQTGKYDYWNPLNSVNFNKPITGLLPTSRGLLVFTANETYAFFGNDITNFQKILLSDNIGCTNHRTCQLIKSIPIWWSEEGLTTFTGGQIKVISRDILADKVDIIDSTVLNDKYYALRAYGYDASGLWESEVLEFDMRRTLSLSKYQIRQNMVPISFSFPNNSHNVSQLSINLLRNVDTIYTHNNQIKCSASKFNIHYGGLLITLDNHANDAEFTYESPVLTEGSFSTLKHIEHINLKLVGDFTVTVKYYLEKREKTQTKTVTGTKYLKLQVDTTASNYLGFQIKVQGTGKLEEISYDPILNYHAQRRLPNA